MPNIGFSKALRSLWLAEGDEPRLSLREDRVVLVAEVSVSIVSKVSVEEKSVESEFLLFLFKADSSGEEPSPLFSLSID